MLTGTVALITGGSRGIGAACARKLAALGADIAVVYAGSHAAAGQTALRMLSVLPIPLLPEVAKGITVFPAKS